MTDREELLRVATEMWAREENSIEEVVEAAFELIQAVNAKCADQPTTIRVKPKPVAWRDEAGGLWRCSYAELGWTPLYEPEDA